MVGILYRKGEVYLVGDKKDMSNKETFTVMGSLADLYSKILSLTLKDEKEVNDYLSKVKSTLLKGYISMMAGKSMDSYLESIKDHIVDDQMGFEIKPEENFKAYLVVEFNNLNSILSTLLYCIVKMSTELCGNIDYVMKGPEFVDHFRYLIP